MLNLADKFGFQLPLLPGMMNQGDMVGNTKGLVVIMTQNGEMLPCGTPYFVVGIVARGTASLLSGIAFAASLGAARTKTVFSLNTFEHKSDKNSGAHCVFFCLFFFSLLIYSILIIDLRYFP